MVGREQMQQRRCRRQLIITRSPRRRECIGLVELPRPRGLAPGMRVQMISGPLRDQIGLLGALPSP
jgi:hypothetical protein